MLGRDRELVKGQSGAVQTERAVENLADRLAAGEVTEVAGVVVGDQRAAPGGGGDPVAVGRGGGGVDLARGAGRPMVQVGVDRRQPLQRRVVHRGDQRVVAAGPHRRPRARRRPPQPQQVVGVALLVDPTTQQLRHKRRLFRGLVLGGRTLFHRDGKGLGRPAAALAGHRSGAMGRLQVLTPGGSDNMSKRY